MSAKCCAGAALGKAHSSSCDVLRAKVDEATRPVVRELPSEQNWQAERAKNLREQRRYELVEKMFLHDWRKGSVLSQCGSHRMKEYARFADSFLDRYGEC